MEKTFEELIEETPLNELLSTPEKDMTINLLKQVREATIAECEEILTNRNYMWDDMVYATKNLATDKIRIDENN